MLTDIPGQKTNLHISYWKNKRKDWYSITQLTNKILSMLCSKFSVIMTIWLLLVICSEKMSCPVLSPFSFLYYTHSTFFKLHFENIFRIVLILNIKSALFENFILLETFIKNITLAVTKQNTILLNQDKIHKTRSYIKIRISYARSFGRT